jgi:hypothetical protein
VVLSPFGSKTAARYARAQTGPRPHSIRADKSQPIRSDRSHETGGTGRSLEARRGASLIMAGMSAHTRTEKSVLLRTLDVARSPERLREQGKHQECRATHIMYGAGPIRQSLITKSRSQGISAIPNRIRSIIVHGPPVPTQVSECTSQSETA